VAFAQHHWPVWGNARVADFLAKQRDLYKYLHDQTVRLMNHGYKASEIAERLALPKSLASTWHVRGYYGTLSHNGEIRLSALYRLVRRESGQPQSAAAGRARTEVRRIHGRRRRAIRRGREDFARGEYRFVAEAMSHVVFADPANAEARQLGADALEQLATPRRSATWRNAYLLGALELRQECPRPSRARR